MNESSTLLDVRDLKTYFPVRGSWFKKLHVHAVDGVSFSITRGQTLALVGESGSGKTTVGRTILGLIPATAGRVDFQGQDTTAMSGGQIRRLRRHMTMIFQDPFGSLNPRMTVGSIIAEPLKVHHVGQRSERRQRIDELLRTVGLDPRYAGRYPHEFSGGQRQRIGIARALASNPEFIVCDEPVSALDVSIQSQILNLLSDLQERMNLTYLFIAHNLAVVEHFAQRVAVMYLGRLVEVADRDELYNDPRHPYTEALFSAVPEPDTRRRHTRVQLEGETPSPIFPPSGCPFHPRCPLTRQVAAGHTYLATSGVSGCGNGKTPPVNFKPQPLPPGLLREVGYQGRPSLVVAKCMDDVPVLEPLSSAGTTSSHCHACHLRR